MAAGEPLNLVRFDDITYGTTALAEPYEQVIVTNGNHFEIFFYRRSKFLSIGLHEASNASKNADWPTIFSFSTGDQIDWRLKNFTVISNATTTGTDKTDVCFKTSAGGILFGYNTVETAITIPNTAGLVGDISYSGTAASDGAVNNFYFYSRNTSSQNTRCRFSFDLEVSVNGTRII